MHEKQVLHSIEGKKMQQNHIFLIFKHSEAASVDSCYSPSNARRPSNWLKHHMVCVDRGDKLIHQSHLKAILREKQRWNATI